MEKELDKKKVNLLVVLTAIFMMNALLGEMIGGKIFSLAALLNLSTDIEINLSVGVIIWPIVFLLSDIINEYFGVSRVKKLSYLAAILIAYSFLVVFFSTEAPPAEFWLQNNSTDAAGNAFNINYAFSVIFRQSMGIIIGSITAFLVSQIIDAYTFQYLRKITGNKNIWIRATGSTAISQVLDSFLILFIAFYVAGNWTFEQVLQVGVVQYIYKMTITIIFIPLIYLAHGIIDRYLGVGKKEISTKYNV